MRIQFARTGGFANIPLSATVEVDQLPAAEADRLRQAVDAVNFFSLPSQITSPAPVPDRFHYVIAIETSEGSHKVSVDETACSSALRSLVEILGSAARSQR